MNGAATRRGDGFRLGGLPSGPRPGAPPPPAPVPAPAVAPSSRMLAEGYRKDMLGGFEKEKPRYNPTNPQRPQSSPMVDLKDPIQVHLLTEIALSDSKGYEILSQEEVDDLKKQIQSLSMRVEQARSNLAIQTKFRDAAINMAKLYSAARPEGRRRSLLGNRASDSAKEADMERQASERRCEELTAELATLERRLIEPKERLLQHTAGILQMTHRAAAKKSAQPPFGQAMPNGIPGSPESLYTSTNARNSLDVGNDDGDFDDKSLYLPLEQMERQPGRPRKNTIEIPMKSPIREQNNQLREELDRVKEENARLGQDNARLSQNITQLGKDITRLSQDNARLKEAEQTGEQRRGAETETLRTQTSRQLRTLSDTERKLEGLNKGLRDVIVAFNPAKNSGFRSPGPATGAGDTIDSQLEYLEDGLAAAAREQSSYITGMSKDTQMASAAAAAAETTLAQAEGRAEGIILQLQDLFQQCNIGPQLPPEPADDTLNEQLNYLENAVRVLGAELTRVMDVSSSVSANRQNNEQVETVLAGLWDIIQEGLAEAQAQKAARKKARLDKGLAPDEDDMSGDEAIDLDEPYSLQAFAGKVRWLFSQATKLKQQKSVLKTQIKQQRELNNKSGSEKDEELKAKLEELAKTRTMLDISERTAAEAQEKLAQTLDDFETLQKTNTANESASAKAVQDQLKERNAAIAALEASYQETQAKLAAAEESSASLQKNLQDKDDEIDRMNMMVIELKTEVTIAKAELDGAYGSRKQRAAEVAALSKSEETAELNTQVAKLKAELASTLRDFEDITRDSITAEKEKLELEGKLDDAEAARASLEQETKVLRAKLEAEVVRLQDQLDAERLRPPPSPAPGGGPGGGSRAGASMLSEQFRATMKEERKKFQEELREEQARRRKLEDELRAAKRNQGGPGRSPLGPLSPR